MSSQRPCSQPGISRITSYTPRRNRTVERYNRILAEDFLYARTWHSGQERADGIALWNLNDNYHRLRTMDNHRRQRRLSAINKILTSCTVSGVTTLVFPHLAYDGRSTSRSSEIGSKWSLFEKPMTRAWRIHRCNSGREPHGCQPSSYSSAVRIIICCPSSAAFFMSSTFAQAHMSATV